MLNVLVSHDSDNQVFSESLAAELGSGATVSFPYNPAHMLSSENFWAMGDE